MTMEDVMQDTITMLREVFEALEVLVGEFLQSGEAEDPESYDQEGCRQAADKLEAAADLYESWRAAEAETEDQMWMEIAALEEAKRAVKRAQRNDERVECRYRRAEI
jgi:hypothetical protein